MHFLKKTSWCPVSYVSLLSFVWLTIPCDTALTQALTQLNILQCQKLGTPFSHPSERRNNAHILFFSAVSPTHSAIWNHKVQEKDILQPPQQVWSLAMSHLALVWLSPHPHQKEHQVMASTPTKLNEGKQNIMPWLQRMVYLQTRYISKGAIITFQSARHRFSLAISAHWDMGATTSLDRFCDSVWK